MIRKLAILGSTGSIGQNTLDVLRNSSCDVEYEILVLTANNNIDQLCRDVHEFKPKRAVIVNDKKYLEVKDRLINTETEVCAGKEALIESSNMGADWTMSAIVGFDGLEPSLASIKSGGTLALANKESLVCAGDYFLKQARDFGSILLPVDSEHNAIFQCLNGESLAAVEKLIITASGGPFRTWPINKIMHASVDQALAHPNWSMGARISIDSASMFNKAMELIEARHLFALPPEKLEVIVHPESIIHSMVNFCDGSIIAQLGSHDMRGAIGYTLNYPVRRPISDQHLDFSTLKKLTFEKPDFIKFPALKLANEVMEKGGMFGTVFNAAKEVALDRYIAGEIGFLNMSHLVDEVLDLPEILSMDGMVLDDFEVISEANKITRRLARRIKF